MCFLNNFEKNNKMKPYSLRSFLILIALVCCNVVYGSVPTIHITASPGDTVCQGVSVTFTATLSATGSYGYQWQLNGASVAGATTSVFTTAALVNHDSVFCELTDITGVTVLANSDTIGMVVDSLPVIAPVTGLDSVCVGSTVHLSDATPGGVWSVTVPAAATISTTGLLTGLAPSNNNRAVYKVTNMCGTDSLRFRVRVNLPAGPVTGVTSLCMDSTTIYRDTARGLWSTSDSTIAKFTNNFGLLQAYATGTVTIYDNVVNACGSTVDSVVLTIVNCDTVAAVPVVTALNKAVSIFPNPNSGSFTISLSGNYAAATCIISNIVGEQIREFKICSGKQTELNLGNHNGIYFISVSAGNERYSAKIVVQ